MDELLADFVAETREMLEALGGEIVAWEADPADGSRLDAIFRFVHTVKGNCGFFDFPRLEHLSHAAEGTLAEVRAGRRQADAALVTAVLAIIDRISEMVDAVEAGEELPENGDEELIAALEEGSEIAELPSAGGPDAGEPKRAGGGNGSMQRSIRLPVALLDRVMSGVSDLVLARNDLARRLRDDEVEAHIAGPFERLSTILEDVREGIARVRMQRIEYLYGSMPRLVRDLSAELGKQVMVDLEGGNVELDREMIEMIRDPVVHIIRNCIDHGIEPPSERLAAGKREIGLLQVSARQTGNKIVLMISDDGRGIDDERLVQKAIAAGIVTEAQAEEMPLLERLELMFSPGLSTAEAVTSISGRGVGMDVVRANIERVGGEVYVSSKRGEGTTIFLRLPLTLSIIPALTVGIGDQVFALPRAHIEEIVDAAAENLEFAEAGDRHQVRVRGRWVPCAWTGEILGVPGSLPLQESLLLVAKLGNGAPLAVSVDRILDHEDLVIKPLAQPVMDIGLYSGTTLLDDGTPMLLLDFVGIVRTAGINADGKTAASYVVEDVSAQRARHATIRVLKFSGLDGRRRVIRMEVVDRIEKVSGSAVEIGPSGAQVVIDGRIFPLAGLHGCELPHGEITLLRLTDGTSEIAYAIDGIVDTGVVDSDITVSENSGDFDCATLFDGEVTELVDCHRLFAAHGGQTAERELPLCRLPLGDPWVDTILRPLVETAGYLVLGVEDGGEADVALAIAGSDAPVPQGSQIIRLRSDPADMNAEQDSIYRYDRAGLLAALAAARVRKSA